MKPKKSQVPVEEIPLGTPLLISWLDSHVTTGWNYRRTEERFKIDLPLVKTIGWLVGISPVGLMLSATTTSNDREGALTPIAIPRGCIIDATVLNL